MKPHLYISALIAVLGTIFKKGKGVSRFPAFDFLESPCIIGAAQRNGTRNATH